MERNKRKCACLLCGKPVDDLEYIRYGGYHQSCWDRKQVTDEKKDYRFEAGYYEWNLYYKDKLVFVLGDPDELLDACETKEDTLNTCKDTLSNYREIWTDKELFHEPHEAPGFVSDPSEIDDDIAAEVMTDELYPWYVKE